MLKQLISELKTTDNETKKEFAHLLILTINEQQRAEGKTLLEI